MCRACYCISPSIRKRKYLVFIVLTIGFISIFGDVVSVAPVTPGLVVSYDGNTYFYNTLNFLREFFRYFGFSILLLV